MYIAPEIIENITMHKNLITEDVLYVTYMNFNKGIVSTKKYIYASEADVLNVALFGMTAKEWKKQNPNLEGNIRDYANVLQLIILSNLENLNAEMINQGVVAKDRLERLNYIAKKQYDILEKNSSVKRIEEIDSHNKLN